MPALGGGFAMLKWISSFPGNPAAHGLPTVMGVVCLSDAATSEPRMLLDARAVTALRTGAVAAVAAQALARRGRRDGRRDRLRAARRLGRALPRRRRLRAGRLLPTRAPRRPPRWRASSAGAPAIARAALACDVVCCVTPGHEPVVDVDDLRPGLHLNMLGADGPGKAEATRRGGRALRAVLRRVGAGVARRRADRRGRGRRDRRATTSPTSAPCSPAPRPAGADADAVTLFDSTGLAIQDLAIAIAAHAAWRDGRVEAQEIAL